MLTGRSWRTGARRVRLAVGRSARTGAPSSDAGADRAGRMLQLATTSATAGALVDRLNVANSAGMDPQHLLLHI